MGNIKMKIVNIIIAAAGLLNLTNSHTTAIKPIKKAKYTKSMEDGEQNLDLHKSMEEDEENKNKKGKGKGKGKKHSKKGKKAMEDEPQTLDLHKSMEEDEEKDDDLERATQSMEEDEEKKPKKKTFQKR